MQKFAAILPVLIGKELVHFFRERGVRIAFLAVPILSAPLIMLLALEVLLLTRSSLHESPIKTCVIEGTQWSITNPIEKELSKQSTIAIVHSPTPEADLKAEKIDAVVSIDNKDDSIHISAHDGYLGDRLRDLLYDIRQAAATDALKEKRLDWRMIYPFATVTEAIDGGHDFAAVQAIAAAAFAYGVFVVGGIASVIFIGEFEHRTVETTLVQPSRRAALLAKSIAATIITFTPFVLGLVSFSTTLWLFLAISGAVSLPTVPPLGVLVLVLAIFTACTFTALIDLYVAILMRGAKLSVMMMNFSNMTILLLGATSVTPGLHINSVLAFVPVLNICLAGQSFIEGRPEYGLSILAFAEMFLLCFIALLLTERLFSLEDVMVNLALRLHKLTNFVRRTRS